MKKLLSVFISVIILLSFAGCSPDLGDSANPTDPSSPQEKQYTYLDLTSAEKELLIQHIGEVIPFVPNNEYTFSRSESEVEKETFRFRTVGNTAEDFSAYRNTFLGYTLSQTYTDDTGKTLFEVVKGDKELVGAYCSDIKTQSQASAPPIVTLEYAVDSAPTVEATVHLGELTEWQDIPEAWVSTTKTDNGYKVVITPPSGAVQYYFFRGKYERGTESYIRNLAPVQTDSGFVVTAKDGTRVKVRMVVDGTTVTWEVFK